MDVDQLRKIVDDISDLPTLPTVATTVSRLATADESTATEIADIISNDQTLTAKILRIANSAFYGIPNEVRTLRAAIVLLGLNSIKNIVLATSVFDAFFTRSGEGEFSREDLWIHSVACGAAAKVVSTRRSLGSNEEFFIAGLMHDLGKVVLDRFVRDEFVRILRLSKRRQMLLYEAEKRVLDVTHAQVGQWLCERWQLPVYIVQSMGYHHSPMDCPDLTQWAAAVHVADILVRTMKIGSGGDDGVPPLDQHAWNLLGLDTSEVRNIAGDIRVELNKAAAFLALLE